MILGAAVGCSGRSLVGAGEPLALGTWGGDGAAVIATEAVTHIHVGCTFGDVSGRIPVDQSGRFTIDGSYVLRAFPIQLGPSLPAKFVGRVTGTTLKLSVTVNDTTAGKIVELGPVTVVLDQPPNMDTCPICRVPRLPAQKVGPAPVEPAAATSAPGQANE